jgi:hypothetical protein
LDDAASDFADADLNDAGFVNAVFLNLFKVLGTSRTGKRSRKIG